MLSKAAQEYAMTDFFKKAKENQIKSTDSRVQAKSFKHYTED